MPCVAMFPWIDLKEQICADEFETLGYKRGVEPVNGSADQAVLDAVFSAYADGGGRVVQSATLLQLKGHKPLDDLTENERADAFEFAEILAFCGLASREYFGNFDYVNRDDFMFFVQSLQNDAGTVVVKSRRRDGYKDSILSGNFMAFRKPPHLEALFPVSIDKELLAALLKARKSNSDGWMRYYEAIQGYGRANTDNPATPIETEIVSLIGSFQRLCEVDANVNSIIPVLDKMISSSEPILPTACARISSNANLLTKYKDRASTQEAWIRDFYAIRGQHGHGRFTVPFPMAWEPHEHLLLGSILFPELLKRYLVQEGHYTLTDADKDELALFERFACARLFELSETTEGPKWPLNEIRRSAFWDNVTKRAVEHLEKIRASNV